MPAEGGVSLTVNGAAVSQVECVAVGQPAAYAQNQLATPVAYPGAAYPVANTQPVNGGLSDAQILAPAPAPVTVAQTREEPAGVSPPAIPFTDITLEAGIDFIHENGATGDKLLPESMGSGAALFDFDGDGHPDLLLVNSTHWPGREPANEPPPTQRLYRNDGTGRFEDVTAGSGLDVSFYATGVAVGDFDNDGFPDILITCVGQNRLFRNTGRGTFVDVTIMAALPHSLRGSVVMVDSPTS